MNKLDVLFLIPRNVQDWGNVLVPGATEKVIDAIEPPMSARWMMAYLKLLESRNGFVYHQAIIDVNLRPDTPEQIAKEVVRAKPRVVVVIVQGYNPSSSTMTMPSAQELARLIKELAPQLPILFTGTHPAAIPVKTLQDEPSIDYVCGGEGPRTVHGLIEAFRAGGREQDISKVESLWYWTGEGSNRHIAHTAPAPLLDLNEWPAIGGWEFMDPKQYQPHHWQMFYKVRKVPYANPFARLGCPFHCSFCNIQAPFREGEEHEWAQGRRKLGVNSFRSLDPKLFVAEVEHLVNTYGVRHFKIPDEMFMLDTSYWTKIFSMIAERFGDELNFWCYARVDTCQPEALETYRRGGGRWVALGIEAANSEVRSGQDKKFGDSLILELIRAMRAAGVAGALNYIFGLPGETPKSMLETLNLALELKGEYSNFYCTMALPGSALYEEATREASHLLPNDWSGFAQYGWRFKPYYRGDALTQAEIVEFRDWAHRTFLEYPAYRDMLRRHPDFGEPALTTIDTWVGEIKGLRREVLGHPRP